MSLLRRVARSSFRSLLLTVAVCSTQVYATTNKPGPSKNMDIMIKEAKALAASRSNDLVLRPKNGQAGTYPRVVEDTDTLLGTTFPTGEPVATSEVSTTASEPTAKKTSTVKKGQEPSHQPSTEEPALTFDILQAPIPEDLEGEVSVQVINNQIVYIVSDKEVGAELIARLLIEQLKTNNEQDIETVFGLATGSTPLGIYERLVADHRANGTSFQHAISVNLDEYMDIPKGYEDQSYVHYMKENLIDHIDMPAENFHIFKMLPSKNKQAVKKEIARMKQVVKKNVPHIQILGEGSGGHIAFNEVGSDDTTTVRQVTLAQTTLDDNARFFNNDPSLVPKYALSLGIRDILNAKQIILAAWGAGKAKAVQKAIEDAPSPQIPASYLQKHKHMLWVIDQDAAMNLKTRDVCQGPNCKQS